MRQRGSRLFGSRLEDATPVEKCAEIIREAIETESPRLRYLVGEDARKWSAGRLKMKDETLVESGREMPLDDYAAFHWDHFGVEI